MDSIRRTCPSCLSHSRTFHVNILLGELLFAADKPNQTGEYLPSKECGSDGPAQKDKINQPILGPFLVTFFRSHNKSCNCGAKKSEESIENCLWSRLHPCDPNEINFICHSALQLMAPTQVNPTNAHMLKQLNPFESLLLMKQIFLWFLYLDCNDRYRANVCNAGPFPALQDGSQ